jgi:hypothetical protein
MRLAPRAKGLARVVAGRLRNDTPTRPGRRRDSERRVSVERPTSVFVSESPSAEPSTRHEKGPKMQSPCIRSLETITLEEALSYIDAALGDELGAARKVAEDRNKLAGSREAPDETEVHHALFLLRRARGLGAPSFDLMRVQLRRRAAA